MKIRIIVATSVIFSIFALSVFSAPTNNFVDVEAAYETAAIHHVDILSVTPLSESINVEISTPKEFNSFASLVNSGAEGYSTAVCTLMCNIDFDGGELIPIGTISKPFSGTFYGNGYKISNFITKKANYSGVVGYMHDGSIRNLLVENGKIDVTYAIAISAGLLCGCAANTTTEATVIENCSATGTIIASSSGASLNVGGLVGKILVNKGDVEISDCFAKADIQVAASNTCYTGGFVGYVNSMSSAAFSIKNCYSNSNINYASGSAQMYAGGFSGYLNQDEGGWSGWYSDGLEELSDESGNLVNCFAITDIFSEAPSKETVGGLCGYVGENIVISNSYRSSDNSVVGGTINTVGTATTANNLANDEYLSQKLKFDMNTVWYIHENNLPYLRALCKANGSPEIYNGASMRVAAPIGLRFKAFVDNLMRSYSAEYGFIVALKSSVGEEELTFDSNIRYASGAAYVSNENTAIDRVYESTDYGVSFTGVLINIPETQYKAVFVARPYVKFVSGTEIVTLYGDAIERSAYQVALAISQSQEYNNLADDEKLVIDTIIST